MYIGCLNKKFQQINYQVYKKDTHEIPSMRVSGNPFENEQM